MDAAIIEWLSQTLNRSFIEGRCVLEVGSRNVNGSPRTVIEPMLPAEYIGIDIEDGPGVNFVMDCIDLPRRFDLAFDLVISCEALEHMQDWQGCFLAMASVAHTLIVTTRSQPFGYHCEHDYWRFSQETMIQIAQAAGLSVVECVQDWEYPGVFIKAVNPKPKYTTEQYADALHRLNHLVTPPTPVLEG